MSSEGAPAVELEDVSKTFHGVTVLERVSLTLSPGEIRGLIGENGSGKSTLLKIACGFHAPDPGACMRVRGQEIRLPVRDAGGLGIAVVHQDLGLVDTVSVLENFGATSAFGAHRGRAIKRKRERQRLAEVCAELDIDLPPDELAGSLSPGQRAFLAIARAVRVLQDSGNGCMLILDEPTVFLGAEETRSLLDLIRSVAVLGIAVVLVSHRLTEVLEVSNTISVMRNGRLVATLTRDDADENRLIRLLLGRDLADEDPPPDPPEDKSPLLLSARGLAGKVVDNVDFDVRAGAILGVTGLAGMGHEELPYLVCGHGARAGTVVLGDRTLRTLNPIGTAKAGMTLVPADRSRDALWGEATAAETLSLTRLPSYRGRAGLRRRAIEADAALQLRSFDVRPPDTRRHMTTFSGGNQQKIIFARALLGRPKALLLHEPTQGVDIGARRQIHTLIREAASDGIAVVVFSTDYQELASLCTDVLVLREGRVTGSIRGAQITETRIARLAQGVA